MTMKRATILQIANYGGPYSGSFIPSLLNLRQSVSEKLGLETAFLLPAAAESRPWFRDVVESGARVALLDPHASRSVRLRLIGRFARENRAVLLHSHFTAFDPETSAVARWQGSKAVWHSHTLMRNPRSRPFFELLRWRVVAMLGVDGIVAVSDAVAQSLREKGADPARIHVIHNGIDTNRFSAVRDRGRTAFAARHGIPADAKIALLFGWAPLAKGVDVLAEACRLVQGNGLNVHCVIVRGERNEDEIQIMAGRAKNVHVVPPVEDVRELYRAADCFVCASRSEAFSYAIAEAMASELPVVSSDLESLRTIYQEAGSGFRMFRSEDPIDLARVLEGLVLAAPDELRMLGQGNRRFAEERFGIDRWSADVTALYRRML
jgi:glycosyltransferase involved in cell wall biosynthesis